MRRAGRHALTLQTQNRRMTAGDGKELDAAALRKMYQGYPTTLNALRAALDRGWRMCKLGHGVKIFCPRSMRDGCTRSVAGSPRSDGNEAKRLRRFLESCVHEMDSGTD